MWTPRLPELPRGRRAQDVPTAPRCAPAAPGPRRARRSLFDDGTGACVAVARGRLLPAVLLLLLGMGLGAHSLSILWCGRLDPSPRRPLTRAKAPVAPPPAASNKGMSAHTAHIQPRRVQQVHY